MGISRKDMLMGLMHSAEQGQKMREGTNLANKKLNEGDLPSRSPLLTAGQPKRGQAVVYGSDDSNPYSVLARPFDKGAVIPMTTQLSPRDFKKDSLTAPGRNETNAKSQVGYGSQDVKPHKVSPSEVSPKEASSVNQHGNVRKGLNQDIVSLPDQEEQRRRENSEAEMRRRSAPDAAINREPVMPSEVRNESNASHRGRIILETLNSLLFNR